MVTSGRCAGVAGGAANRAPMEATDELTRAAAPLILGRYRLGKRLGSGGFGTVYEAVDERLDRDVAVKVIPAGAPAPERAAREAMTAARLDHPGIVAVFDAGEDGEARYLVSELVRGRTLDRLEADGQLSDRDVVRVGLAVADALEHAHERGVIHRDVKPQNVIVPDRPRSARSAAKLTDFGVAHLAGDPSITRTGDVVGTLAYMAPEQADGRKVDEQADLYSLSLVLYEGLAGVNPVRGGTPAATARKVGTVLPALQRKRKDLPADLCAALDRALLPRPEDRGTLEELAPERAGTALVIAVAAALAALVRGTGRAWAFPALAPILGLAALACAYPALAGRARAAYQRAALGAAGAVWLLLAEPLLDRRLLTGTRPTAGWGDDARRAFDVVIAPPFSSGLILLAAVWGLAALVLPWIVRGRYAGPDIVAASA